MMASSCKEVMSCAEVQKITYLCSNGQRETKLVFQRGNPSYEKSREYQRSENMSTFIFSFEENLSQEEEERVASALRLRVLEAAWMWPTLILFFNHIPLTIRGKNIIESLTKNLHICRGREQGAILEQDNCYMVRGGEEPCIFDMWHRDPGVEFLNFFKDGYIDNKVCVISTRKEEKQTMSAVVAACMKRLLELERDVFDAIEAGGASSAECSLILVEGTSAKLFAYQLGLALREGFYGVLIVHTKSNKNLIKILNNIVGSHTSKRRYGRIVLALDNDYAGINRTYSLLKDFFETNFLDMLHVLRLPVGVGGSRKLKWTTSAQEEQSNIIWTTSIGSIDDADIQKIVEEGPVKKLIVDSAIHVPIDLPIPRNFPTICPFMFGENKDSYTVNEYITKQYLPAIWENIREILPTTLAGLPRRQKQSSSIRRNILTCPFVAGNVCVRIMKAHGKRSDVTNNKIVTSTRYVHFKLNEIDRHLCRDGHAIVPLAILYGRTCLAFRFSKLRFPSFNLISIIANLEKLLRGNEPIRMTPQFWNFQGKIEITEDPLKFECYGTIENTEDNWYKLTKTNPYQSNQKFIKVIKRNFSMTGVKAHFNADGSAILISKKPNVPEEKFLKCYKSSSTLTINFATINREGFPKRHSSVNNFLKEFFEERLQQYIDDNGCDKETAKTLWAKDLIDLREQIEIYEQNDGEVTAMKTEKDNSSGNFKILNSNTQDSRSLAKAKGGSSTENPQSPVKHVSINKTKLTPPKAKRMDHYVIKEANEDDGETMDLILAELDDPKENGGGKIQTQCNQSFAIKEVLNRHMKRHTGECPHVCQECGKSFIQATQLRNHSKTHIRPIESLDCDEKFKTEKQLERHAKIHSSKRLRKSSALKCSVCKTAFKTADELKEHMEKENHTRTAPKRKLREPIGSEKGTILLHGDTVYTVIPLEQDDDPVPSRNKSVSNDIKKEQRKSLGASLAAAIADEPNDEVELIELDNLEDIKLKENVRKLLDMLVDAATLKQFSWPKASVEEVLCKVIENCGHDLSKDAEMYKNCDYATRMREYVKLLFTVVIHNDYIKELLNNYPIDEVIEYVLGNDGDDDDEDDDGDAGAGVATGVDAMNINNNED